MSTARLARYADALVASIAPVGVDRGALTRVLERARLGRAKSGSVILREGAASDALYVLLEGRVRVRARDLAGELRELAVLEAPALLGHMGMVDDSPRSARCVADGEVLLARLDAETCAELFGAGSAEGAALRRLLLRSLGTQLARGNERLREMLEDPITGPVVAAHRPREDPSVRDLLGISGALEGWTVRDADLASMEVVVTDDDG